MGGGWRGRATYSATMVAINRVKAANLILAICSRFPIEFEWERQVNSFENCLVVVLQKSSEAADDKKQFSGRKSPYRYTKHTHNSMHHCCALFALRFWKRNGLSSLSLVCQCPRCNWVRQKQYQVERNKTGQAHLGAVGVGGLQEWCHEWFRAHFRLKILCVCVCVSLLYGEKGREGGREQCGREKIVCGCTRR